MPPQRKGQRSADFAEQFLEMPPIKPPPGLDSGRAPAQRPPSADPFTGIRAPRDRRSAATPRRKVLFRPMWAAPCAGQSAFPDARRRVRAACPAHPGAAAGRRGRSRRHVSSGPASAGGADAILRAIATGAGVSPEVFLQRPAGDVAAEIGLVLRTVVEELALLLKARAAAKVLAKSGNRTMISAVDNNPLKFVPRAEEVLEIMFAKQRAGYLDAKHSIDEAFRDLKTHEFATYAAMQKALSRLLEDLSPEAIEKKVSSSTFSSKKARSWEIFVATWEAKEKPHENGMLDVFLAYFSDAYAKASKPR